MSKIVPFPQPTRRNSARAQVLDLVAKSGATAITDLPSDEEHEFLEALRRIFAGSPADELWNKYQGGRHDHRAGIFARYAE